MSDAPSKNRPPPLPPRGPDIEVELPPEPASEPVFERGRTLRNEPVIPPAPEPRPPGRLGARIVMVLSVLVVLGALGSVAAIPVPCAASGAALLEPQDPAVSVLASADGRIRTWLVKPGDWVEKGGELARLDDGPVREALLSIDRSLRSVEQLLAKERKRDASAAARQARARHERAVAQLERAKANRDKLAAIESPSARDRRSLERAEQQVAALEAEVQAAAEEVEEVGAEEEIDALTKEREALLARKAVLEKSLQSLSITAPGTGVVVSARREGDPVKAGETIAQIEDTRTLRARISLTTDNVSRVKAKDRVLILLPDRPGTPIEATLSSVGPAPGNLLWTAEAILPNEDGRIPAHAAGAAQVTCGQFVLARYLARDLF